MHVSGGRGTYIKGADLIVVGGKFNYQDASLESAKTESTNKHE